MSEVPAPQGGPLAEAQRLTYDGRAQEAVSFAERAVLLASNPVAQGEALLFLGDLQVQLGRMDEAESTFMRLAELASQGNPSFAQVARDRLQDVGLRRRPPTKLKLSPSVEQAVASLDATSEVPATVVAAELLRTHPEYGNKTAAQVEMEAATDGPLRSVHQWLLDVRALFDPTQAPELHGRLVLLGLALLDETVRTALDQRGAFDAIRGELREPFDDLLSPEGRALVAGGETPAPRHEETVPTHTDNPAKVDELGRKAVARILARRIRDMRAEEADNAAHDRDKAARRGGAFLVHLHAPWGAGKTSLLNFLADELRKEDPQRWVVVNFNAWRHQRIAPPWWWLMTTMYTESVRELGSFRGVKRLRALTLRLHEWWWRVKGGWPGFVMLVLGAAMIVVVWKAGFVKGATSDVLAWKTIRAFLLAAAAILTPALTLWGFVRGVSRWVFATSARGARRFIDNTRDPMQLVHEHVHDLVRWAGADVVVMIDDLDRCKGPYVVELLEGIQTLFRDVPLTFVVAADRDWLADSYADEYAKFVSTSDEPGRPLGYLFLEKTFQISAGLPPVGVQLDGFWNRLLRMPKLPSEKELDRERRRAADELGGKPSRDLGRVVAEEPGTTPAQVQARREVVAVEMAGARAAAEAAHTLEPFKSLLGRNPNPRAMKRLVNAYGIARGIEVLHGHNIEGEHFGEQQTALWTILNLRWPKLGDHLAVRPEDVELIGDGKPPTRVPRDLRPLFEDDEVVAVVRGDAADVAAQLDADTLQTVTLRSA
jgi:KAP-like P-loop domain-containing protein